MQQFRQLLTKDKIKEIFLANGFTIKEGQEDLKEYVYEAANGLLMEYTDYLIRQGALRGSQPTRLVPTEYPITLPDAWECYLVPGTEHYLRRFESPRAIYHTVEHCLKVSKIFVEIMKTNPNWDNMSKELKMAVVTAAAFHDCGHSAGLMPDSENVRNAINHFETFLLLNAKDLYTDEILEICRGMITCTQFPFSVEPVTFYEQALRDADILYSLTGNRKELIEIQARLYMECRIAGTFDHQRMDLQAWGERNASFYKNVKFYTKYGENYFHDQRLKGGALEVITAGLKDVDYMKGEYDYIGSIGGYAWLDRKN